MYLGRIGIAIEHLKLVQNEEGKGIPVKTDTNYCEVFHYEKENKIHIVFKGSGDWDKNLFSWKDDFSYHDLDFDVDDNGFHDEFEIAYETIKLSLYSTIDHMINHYTSIHVESYSSGGGLAILCLINLQHHICFKFNLYSRVSGTLLGCPAILNRSKLSSTDQYLIDNLDILRVINGWDLVGTSGLYKKVDLDFVGKVYRFPQPFYHKIFRRLRDHRFEEYEKSYKKALISV